MSASAHSHRRESSGRSTLRDLASYALAVGAGCLVFPVSQLFFLLWMDITPRPTTIGSIFGGNGPFVQWIIFFLLYVPEMVAAATIGFVAGWFKRRSPFLWIALFTAAYSAFMSLQGYNPWDRAVMYVYYHAWGDAFFWGMIAIVVLGTPFATAWLAVRLRPRAELGVCKKCGYLLYKLPSSVCPECGTAFELDEATCPPPQT